MNIDDASPVISQGSQMKACPYLGLREDPQTSLLYPSQANLCLHSDPVASPNLSYQGSVCLKGRPHTSCPVFISSVAVPLPAEISMPAGGWLNPKRFVLPIMIGIIVVVLVVLGVLWAMNGRNGSVAAPTDLAASSTPSPTAISLATDTLLSVLIPITPNSNTDTPTATPTATGTSTLVSSSPAPAHTPLPCGRPYNWTTYVVRPGDSLFGLSLVYGVTVADLQRANCMGTSTVLRSGQILYVPARAVNTPLPTSISTPTDTPVILPSDTPTEIPTEIPSDTPVPTEIPSDTPNPS